MGLIWGLWQAFWLVLWHSEGEVRQSGWIWSDLSAFRGRSAGEVARF